MTMLSFIAVILTGCVLIVMSCTVLYVCIRIMRYVDKEYGDSPMFGAAMVFAAALICATLGVIVRITGPIYHFFLG